jgi:hypothetical protein
MPPRTPKLRLRPVAPEEAQRLVKVVEKAIDNFSGYLDDLEAAIGMYMVGRHFGWKVIALIHNKRTIRKYEEILGIDIRQEFPAETPISERNNGYRLAKKLSNFWKAVSGDTPIPDRGLTE